MKTPSLPAFVLPRVCLSVALVLLLASSQRAARAQDEASAEQLPFSAGQLEFFETKIRPVLVERCFECHGDDPDSVEGGLLLTSRKTILEGGDSGPAIDLEAPEDSLILSAIEYGELFQMPPESKLSDEQIGDFRKWILEGAAWPAEESDGKSAEREVFDLEARRKAHWCWQAVTCPSIPDSGDDWALDPIDRFVRKRLDEKGLVPAPAASRETWIRRVTYDLTGLPPTVAEIDEFLGDESADAFEKVVDRLLASPHFGERWARHWMDLIRYAETCGHEFDYPIPNAWQYRDYLIRAFNADVPYDEFVTEHIAGDLVSEPRLNPENGINESVLGTGFWFLGEATHGPVDVKGDEAGRIDNQIDVFGKTFLGLTVACARCHDHKFDAISAKDYYAISGFLQSSRRQDVLLDPGNRIANASAEIRKIQDQFAHRLYSSMSANGLKATMLPDLGKYLASAARYMQLNSGPNAPALVRMEGEAIQEPRVTAGVVEKQTIAGFDSWSGGSQLWWREARPGDRLTFSLEVPVKAEYRVKMQMTMANDYGIVQLHVNGEKAGEPFDGYSSALSVSGHRDFCTVILENGTNKFELEIVGKNDQAIERYMLGIDDIVLEPAIDVVEGPEAEKKIVDWCAEHDLHVASFRKCLGILNAKLPIGVSSALGQLQFVAKGTSSVLPDTPDYREEESFANPDTWSSTGFVHIHEPGVSLDLSSPESPIRWFSDGKALHTGRRGLHFQGTLRSPTFVITRPYIHYLSRASKARFRVIIDGFQLDVYNPLLFEGITIPADTAGEWKWITQSGDLKNYVGHRAYIEIVDDGDGFAEVREIVFSDMPSPPSNAGDEVIPRDHDSAAATTVEEGSGVDGIGDIAQNVEREWQELIAGANGIAGAEWNQKACDQMGFLLWHGIIEYGDARGVVESAREFALSSREVDAAIPEPVKAIGMTDGTEENEFVFIRGNHKNPGEEAPRQPLTALPLSDRWHNLTLSGSGRKELAEDLTHQDNPLVYRVMVNRLWHHLTGRGIVATVDNFGELGSEPSNPELLDFLTESFRLQGYSVKSLIRRIVLSATYRMESRPQVGNESVDPDNELMHRFRVRRLQGEAIRDAMLQVSGQLDRSLYGPPVPIHLTDFMQGRGRPGSSGPLDGAGRRSIYVEVRRNFLWPMMLAFDTPIPFNTIGKRNISNVPAQSLILLNDPLVSLLSEKWAARLIAEHESTDDRIVAAFRSALGRAPGEAEMNDFRGFINSQAEIHEVDADDIATSLPVWADFCHVVFNLKEFIYID